MTSVMSEIDPYFELLWKITLADEARHRDHMANRQVSQWIELAELMKEARESNSPGFSGIVPDSGFSR